MTGEIGHFALVMALAVAVSQALVPQIGAWRRDLRLMAFADYAALGQLAMIALAFVALAETFVTSDFSVRLVAQHSNRDMPLFFRLAATWGNHEGSLVLWVLILALFGAGLALFGRGLAPGLKARALSVQATLAVGFLCLSLFTSNPFERLHPAPREGMELNPLLQDVGLVFHPPFLYLGYVGFSVVFSLAVAGLLEGRVDAIWARFLRPWALAAWVCLTVGIALGSFWAYYELGWGGWWFWDPVENASFMPWLVGTALVHSAIVVEQRQTLLVWTLLLSVVTFSLSLVGTFLVRSGILSSVHAFATDPVRGIGVLLLISLFTGGAFLIYALRSHKLEPMQAFTPVSREGGIVLNNILLVVAAATVFLGTFYPLVVQVMGPERISVGAPYFDRTFVPLMVPLMIAVSIGPVLRWKRDRLRDALGRLRWPTGMAALGAVAAAAWWLATGEFGGFGLLLGGWLVLGALWIWAARVRLTDRDPGRSLRLMLSTPRATWGMVAAHAGLGLFVIGVTGVSAWQQEAITTLAPGRSLEIGGYSIRLDDVSFGRGPNYQLERGRFTVSRGSRSFEMSSEKRFYPVSQSVTTEAGIRPQGLSNLYIALGDAAENGSYVVRIYYHPLVLLIWFGPALMALGGLLSISDRRFRVGAPGQKRLHAMIPAET